MSRADKKAPKRRIKKNVWGNTNGYEGSRKVYDFGTDEQAAQIWVDGGPLPKFDASVFKNTIVTKQTAIETAGGSDVATPGAIDAMLYALRINKEESES